MTRPPDNAITADMLLDLCACSDQRRLFDDCFPNGWVIPTLDLAEAVGWRFDVYWFVHRAMSGELEREFAKAYEAIHSRAVYEGWHGTRRIRVERYKAFVPLWQRHCEDARQLSLLPEVKDG